MIIFIIFSLLTHAWSDFKFGMKNSCYVSIPSAVSKICRPGLLVTKERREIKAELCYETEAVHQLAREEYLPGGIIFRNRRINPCNHGPICSTAKVGKNEEFDSVTLAIQIHIDESPSVDYQQHPIPAMNTAALIPAYRADGSTSCKPSQKYACPIHTDWEHAYPIHTDCNDPFHADYPFW
jgi:hypothetical protein